MTNMPLQSVAIPYRISISGDLEVMVVTSRRKGRWVCPKGKVKTGHSASSSAAREAFEEAGVTGEIARTPIATYEKTRSRGGVDLVIPMRAFPLLVETEASFWPEMHQRARRWMATSEALEAIEDKNLRSALLLLAEQLSQTSGQ